MRPDEAETALNRLARHHGIATGYEEPSGGVRRVPEATLRLLLRELGVDPEARPEGSPAAQTLTAPAGVACHLPGFLDRAPAWGISCQLYALRSGRNWGIGDFRDLADLARIAATAGADFLGVNPVHAPFLADPDRRSPFSPSNRRFLNPLYIAPDAAPGIAEPDPAELARLRRAELVDYERVASLKIAALRNAFARRPFDVPPYDRPAFEAFREAGGAALERHARFEALSAEMVAAGRAAGWQSWPAPLRDAAGPAVAAFAAAHADAVTFHIWLQWLADIQLAEAREAARAAGMGIGLYLDLAVGEAPDGSATWSDPDLALSGLVIGAPPDVFAEEGQTWGLSAPSPRVLAGRDYAPYRATIAAQLRYAGALRIDHAMALWQLFLIPEGEPPAAGTHLRYPLHDLLGVLAEESRAAEALIIGEDLGFVPEGFREAMAAACLFSYRILYFEQAEDAFAPAADYPSMALSCLSTHDLPPLSAWWRGDDIALRRTHGLVEPAASEKHARHRAQERRMLLKTLVAEGLLTETATGEEPPADLPAAVHRFLARTPCRLAGVRLADLVGPEAPANLPGTIDAYPNWRLRYPVDVADIPALPAFREVTAAVAEERPRRI